MNMQILYKYLFKASFLTLFLSMFPNLYGQSKVDDNYINSSNKSTSIPTKNDFPWETGDLNSYVRQGSSFLFYSNGSCLRLTVCTSQIIRFEFSGNGHFLTPVIDISKKEWQPVIIDFNESENQLEITTGMLAIIINKKPFHIKIADQSKNNTILDDTGLGTYSWSKDEIRKSFINNNTQHFFGLGMHETGGLELEHRTYETKDPASGFSYVPFFFSTRGYGIYVNTFRKMEFDFSTKLSLKIPDNVLDYYFIYGPDVKDIVDRFTQVTGRSPMPPKWFLGFILSKYGNENATFEEITGIQSKLRKDDYPIDLFVFDYGWRGNEYLGSPQWKIDNHFELLEDMKKLNLKYQLHYACYPNDFPDLPVLENKILDITAPQVGDALWQRWFLPRINEGMAMILLDGALTWPHIWIKSDQVQFDNGLTMTDMASYYQYLLSEILYKKTTQYTGKRTFVQVPGSNNAGLQKYAFVWSGDIGNSDTSMSYAVKGFLSMGLCGNPYFSNDLGGFKTRPTSDAYIRWVAEMGAFCPVMRTHGHGGREPWLFSDSAQQIFRQYDKLRYRLMPYNYTYAWEAHTKGYPIARPMVWQYQDKPDYFQGADLQYFWGEYFLVHPVAEFKDSQVSIFIPPGRWFDYWTGKPFAGPQTIMYKSPLGLIPVFIKEGAIIPMAPEMSYTGEKPWSPLILDIYPGKEPGRFTLYEDDGISFQCDQGNYALTDFSCVTGRDKILVTMGETKGDYAGMIKERSYCLMIHNCDKPEIILGSGEKIPEVSDGTLLKEGTNGWYYNKEKHTVMINLKTIKSGVVELKSNLLQ